MINIFISDLHLEEDQPAVAELFLRFLTACTKHADSLYILGDFFESWIGDDNLTPFNLKIMQALRDASQTKLKIFFMHGNRDFLIGKKFLRASGCQLLPEECVIDLDGQRTLLMHGDTLCTEDRKYLKFRKKARNWFFQQLFLLKSLKKRLAIVEQYRAASKQHTSTLPDYLMDVTPDEVKRVMKKHDVNFLIHGHTHRPGVNEVTPGATRTVLGAWHEGGNALICRDGKQTLVDLKLDETIFFA